MIRNYLTIRYSCSVIFNAHINYGVSEEIFFYCFKFLVNSIYLAH